MQKPPKSFYMVSNEKGEWLLISSDRADVEATKKRLEENNEMEFAIYTYIRMDEDQN